MQLKHLVWPVTALLLFALTAAAQQLPAHFIQLHPETVYSGELHEHEAKYFYFTLQQPDVPPV